MFNAIVVVRLFGKTRNPRLRSFVALGLSASHID
jgi:hypothetical protein